MILHETQPSESEYVAAINHELRTPLNVILGFSDLLADAQGLDTRQRRYAENIRLSGHRLMCVIDEIIALARRSRDVEIGPSAIHPVRHLHEGAEP